MKISREELIFRLCSEFNIARERVDQNNINIILILIKPSRYNPIKVEEIIWWIKNHGLKNGLKVFVAPRYTNQFLRYNMRAEIYRKRKEDDVNTNGLELKHITGYYLKLKESGINTIEDIARMNPCELFELVGMDNHEIESTQNNLKKYGYSLKLPVNCCRHK